MPQQSDDHVYGMHNPVIPLGMAGDVAGLHPTLITPALLNDNEVPRREGDQIIGHVVRQYDSKVFNQAPLTTSSGYANYPQSAGNANRGYPMLQAGRVVGLAVSGNISTAFTTDNCTFEVYVNGSKVGGTAYDLVINSSSPTNFSAFKKVTSGHATFTAGQLLQGRFTFGGTPASGAFRNLVMDIHVEYDP